MVHKVLIASEAFELRTTECYRHLASRHALSNVRKPLAQISESIFLCAGEVVTIPEMEKLIKKLDTKITKNEGNPAQVTLVSHLKKEKLQYERCRPNLEQYWKLVESIFDAKTQEAVCFAIFALVVFIMCPPCSTRNECTRITMQSLLECVLQVISPPSTCNSLRHRLPKRHWRKLTPN